MANITFLNNTLIPGTTFNPGLEDILDRGGIVGGQSATTLTITNASGGTFNGFKFEVKGTNFTFTNGIPTAGTITSISVKAPNGTTQIIEVTAGAGGFGNTNLKIFYDGLKGTNGGVEAALDRLLGNTDSVAGSTVADRLTAFGSGDSLFGVGGNDILTARVSATMIGGAGNDTFRIGSGQDYVIAGADLNGIGGGGETNTLEIRGDPTGYVTAAFDAITDIDALRFVDTAPPNSPSVWGADLGVDFLVDQIGNGRLALDLAVRGSSAASPHSENSIDIYAEFDRADTTAVKLDLSGWTFTDWNQNRNSVFITTNQAVALNDRVIGTSVADSIRTNAGHDTIRGGGGADSLDGGEGGDTFVYGRNEAVKWERVIGDDSFDNEDNDRVLVLADNDFTGVEFYGIERLAFGGKAMATFSQSFLAAGPRDGFGVALSAAAATVVGDGQANTLAFVLQNRGDSIAAIDLSDVTFQSWSKASDRVMITGTRSHNDISGSMQNDIINGAGGRDDLQGNEGGDAFVFSAGFGRGVSHVADFTKGEDKLHLDDAVFGALKPGGLGRKAFGYGMEATRKKQFILFDKETGTLRYDDDGSGKQGARIVAVLDDVANLKHGDILVI